MIINDCCEMCMKAIILRLSLIKKKKKTFSPYVCRLQIPMYVPIPINLMYVNL